MQAEIARIKGKKIEEKKEEKEDDDEGCDCGKKGCKVCNPEVKKETFADSLANMLHDASPNHKNWDGIPRGEGWEGKPYTEDSLLPMIDPNTGMAIAPSEPKAGSVGFSPETRFGLGS